MAAAMHSRDAFGKIKGLISDMIARLEVEAGADATKKAYCDKELIKCTNVAAFSLDMFASLAQQDWFLRTDTMFLLLVFLSLLALLVLARLWDTKASSSPMDTTTPASSPLTSQASTGDGQASC